MSEPISGRWYWVRLEGETDEADWFPAKREPDGWTNEDTWEDFDNEVAEWKLIPLPGDLT
jgi:hypothetical protein